MAADELIRVLHAREEGTALSEFAFADRDAPRLAASGVRNAAKTQAAAEAMALQYCIACQCGDDAAADASMSGTFRWPNSHVFQWLPALPPDTAAGLRTGKVVGWKAYLLSRPLCAIPTPPSWTLSKDGKLPPSVAGVSGLPKVAATALLRTGKRRGPRSQAVPSTAPVPPQTLGEGETCVQYHPSTLDGLSFALTLLHAIRSLSWCPVVPLAAAAQPEVVVVIAGASRKAEQRVAACTPYLREVLAAISSVRVAGSMPGAAAGRSVPLKRLSFVLVGPEVDVRDSAAQATEDTAQDMCVGQWHDVLPYEDCSGTGAAVRFRCVRGTVDVFLARCFESPLWQGTTSEGSPGVSIGTAKLHRGNTLLFIPNPGFGNSNGALLQSWLPSLRTCLASRMVTVCSCANHDTDGLGETAVWHSMGGRLERLAPLQQNPFAAMVSMVPPGGVGAGAGPEFRRAASLAKKLKMPLVGDIERYTANAWWYAVRGK